MKRLCMILGLAAALLSSASASAATLRYAIVIGSNTGIDPQAGPMPPLQHAEREAEALRQRLSDCCNFRGARTILLQAPTYRQVEEAFERIAALMQQDRLRFAGSESLFGFFFTGHGLQGRLLVRQGHMGRSDLERMFAPLKADLVIGMIDACFSGSIDVGVLAAKGVRPTPGINPVRTLPQELLSTEGSIWFLSSGANQTSYEDTDKGGVFTHYFTEALQRAPRDGPGISLDRIWSYARNSTVKYTQGKLRTQNPEKVVSRLTTRGALYFSFPQERSATVELSSAVAGGVLISYDDGRFTEVVDNVSNRARRVAVFPGKLRLSMGAEDSMSQTISLAAGGLARVQVAGSASRPLRPLGYEQNSLSLKGGEGRALTVVRTNPKISMTASARLAVELASPSVLSPRLITALAMRWDRGPWVVDLAAGYGHGQRTFDSWSYRLDAGVLDLTVGRATDIDGFRVAATGRVGARALFQTYGDGTKRQRPGAVFAGGLSAGHPLTRGVGILVSVEGGAVLVPGVGAQAEYIVSPFFGLSASLSSFIL